MHRTEIEAALGEYSQLFDVVGDAAADAAERERRANDERKAQRPGQLDGLRQAPGEPALRHIEADRPHRVLEELAILGNLDRLDRGANQLDAEAVERAGGGQIDGQIEAGLPADGRQQGVWTFALDDGRQHVGRQRLDIGAVGQLRIGHDRRRIAVHEHDLEPFGAQRLARLGA